MNGGPDLDPGASLPGFIKGEHFTDWHARYQKSVAYHEAGHTVAFVWADRAQLAKGRDSNFQSLLYVEASGAAGGQVGLSRVSLDYSELLGADHPPVHLIELHEPTARLILKAIEHDILSHLAGPYAQVVFEQGDQPISLLRKYAHSIDEAQSDFRAAFELHGEFCRIRQRQVPFSDLEESALLLVKECWVAIDLLANTLLNERYLSADEVYPLVLSQLPNSLSIAGHNQAADGTRQPSRWEV